MREEPRSGCPINAGLEALGDPWALLVLRDIIFGNRRHFRELLRQSEEGIASNIPSAADSRTWSRQDCLLAGRPRVASASYSLTEAGIQTVPIMVALGSWGLAHRQGTPELRVRAKLLRDGGPQLWEELMDELREAHLGIPPPQPGRPGASGQLQQAYARLANPEQTE